jgi:uncharacterized protein YecE (DUF72 family)
VYTDAELDRLADMLPAAPNQPTYVLFNNLPRVDDARRFRAILARRPSRWDGPMRFRSAGGLTGIEYNAKEQ